jgi:hypothetical protein
VAGIAGILLTREIHLNWRLVPIALIGLWTPAQIFWRSTVNPALSAREAVYWGAGSLAFVLASQILRNRSARNWFLKTVLAGCMVLAVAAIIQKYATPRMVFGLFPAPDSTFGTFYYENQFAALMKIAAPIALWRILRGDAIYGGAAYAILFGATLVSNSRAGVGLMLLELAVFLLVALLTRRIALPVIGLIFGLLVVAGLIVGTDAIRAHFEDQASEQVRLDLAKSTWQMIRQRPLWGSGMGTWRPIYPRFATFDIALTANEAHDDWLQWSAEGGIVFSGLIGLLAVSLALPAVRSIWGLGFLVVLVHSLVDYVLREPALAFIWFVIGGAILASDGLDSLNSEVSP